MQEGIQADGELAAGDGAVTNPDEMRQCKNTDRELWRGPDEGCGDYYADNIFVTEGGGIGINCGGYVIVKPLRDWHALAVAAEPRLITPTIAELEAILQGPDKKVDIRPDGTVVLRGPIPTDS